MPKFSIIVGVYNQADTLPALIESLQKQSFQDYEVHFCDDGSDDGSREIIEKYVPPNNTSSIFYHRQEHQGMRLAKNLNQGIRAARGEYCLLVMADSMLELDYLEILNEYVKENRIVCGIRIQIDSVGGRMEGVDIDWRLKKNLIPDTPGVIVSLPWLCLTGNGLTIPTEAFRKYGPLCEALEGYGGEDNEIVARLFFKGYLCWSVPDLRLFHKWHRSRESNPENAKIVVRLIESYER